MKDGGTPLINLICAHCGILGQGVLFTRLNDLVEIWNLENAKFS